MAESLTEFRASLQFSLTASKEVQWKLFKVNLKDNTLPAALKIFPNYKDKKNEKVINNKKNFLVTQL